MLALIIDAVILIGLVNLILEDEISFISALMMSFGTLLFCGLTILGLEAVGLHEILAQLLGSVVGCGFLGFALAFFNGAPVKSCCIVAASFFGSLIVVHTVLGLLFRM